MSDGNLPSLSHGNDQGSLSNSAQVQDPQAPAQNLSINQTWFSISQSNYAGGLLPSPEELKAYNAIIPDGANRLLVMAEKQAAHRMSIEDLVIDSQQALAHQGQRYAFWISVICVVLATAAALKSQTVFASVLGGGTVVSLATAFVFSKQKQRSELASKREAAEEAMRKRRRKV